MPVNLRGNESSRLSGFSFLRYSDATFFVEMVDKEHYENETPEAPDVAKLYTGRRINCVNN